MTETGQRILATVVGPPAVAAVGYLTGRHLWATEVCRLGSLAGLAAVALALTALFRPGERAAGCALLAYVALAAGVDPFAWCGDREDAVPGLLWLTPAVVGAAAFPRRGWWLAGAGSWAVLFAATAALAYSCTHWGSGVGLFYAWLS